jgi:uncharacterized membrane protein YeiH
MSENFANILYIISLVAVVSAAAAGVLQAGFHKFDLFGGLIIAITTGLGGGSLRDLLLDVEVFWIKDEAFLIASIIGAVLMFVIARFIKVEPKHFLIIDALSLSAFAIGGTLVALNADASIIIASFMGMITAVMGGVFRDILCNSKPVVFYSSLYAVPSWIGSLLFIYLIDITNITTAVIVSSVAIFMVRVLAIIYNITLPKFSVK